MQSLVLRHLVQVARDQMLRQFHCNSADEREFCNLHVRKKTCARLAQTKESPDKREQESCAVAKMTAQCALYTGAAKICGAL